MTFNAQKLGAALGLVLSFALFSFLPTWSILAGWMQRGPLAGNPWGIFIALTLMVGVLRISLFQRPPQPARTFAFFWLTYQCAFHSRWMPYNAQPTYLFLLIFFHAAVAGALFLWDPAAEQMARLSQAPRFQRLRKPFIAMLAGWAIIAVLLWMLRAQVFSGMAALLVPGPGLYLLTPALGSWIRKRRGAQAARYAEGLVLVVSLTAFMQTLFALYCSLWLQVQFDVWLAPSLQAVFARVLPFFKFPDMKPEGVVAPAAPQVPMWIVTMNGWIKALPARMQNGWSQGATQARRYQRVLHAVAYALAVTALGFWIGPKIYQHFYVTVVEFTPKGLIGPRTVIRIRFSGAVRPLAGDVSKLECFKIDPPLHGAYRQESATSIVFVPSEPIRPSSRYTVTFDGRSLTAVPKRLERHAATRFNTELLAVTDAKLFYAYDLVTNEERQLTGEVQFNQPVAIEDLRKALRVAKGNAQVTGTIIEKSHVPTRFYFKSAAIAREKDEQVMTLFIAKGLSAINGNTGLEEEFMRQLVLPSKVKLEAAETKLWHEPDNTLVSVLFNMPVSEDQLRAHLTVTPAVGFKIQTEYCYAVLRGDFKPNVTYVLKITPGLVSRSGETLEHEYKSAITITDLQSTVNFAQKGNILAVSGPKTLAVHTVNLDKVHVEIRKVFRNNLIQFMHNETYTPMSQEVYSGNYDVTEGRINEDVTQYINLQKFHDAPYKGLFSISIRDPNTYYGGDTGWFLCTDLGLVSKQSGDDLIVYALSVETLRPQAGAVIQLVADNNQVIDKKTTDETGRVVFTNWKKNEFKFNPLFLIAQKDEDLSFLEFNRSELNAYSFPIGGDAYGKEGMEAFLTPERGVYRPGEKAYITAIVRKADGSSPDPVPFRLTLRDPQGAETLTLEQTPAANGLMAFTVPFTSDALTGHYDAQLFRVGKPESLGSTGLKVEEFIPDKLKVDVVAPVDAVAAEMPLTFTVRGRQLFGPPAVGAKVSTHVRFLARDFSPPAYKGFTFSDPSRSFEEDVVNLGDDTLDDKGEKLYSVEVPRVNPPSALKAYLYSEVFDTGGRPVSAASFADIHPYAHYLGMRVEKNEPIHAKETVKLEMVAVTPAGKPETGENVRLVIKRKAWYSIFRRSAWGRSNYQSSSYEELVENKTLMIRGHGVYEFTPEQSGDYTVYLVSASGMRTGLQIPVLGLGVDATSLESPEKLKIVPDKESYDIGDKARFLIQTPFSGRLILTLEREKVYETRILDVSGHETSVTFDVDAKHLPNMYVVGILLRTPDEARKTLPMVSFGAASLNVKTTTKRIALDWDTPTHAQSANGIEAGLKVSGDPDATRVVLTAVDQGILQITNFQAPDPLGFFYRKRGLTTQSYSIFDRVLPDLPNRKFALGGDEGGAFSRRHLNPIAAKKKKSMALYSGILTPGPDGRVHYHFDTKGFNGEVRLMALAVHGNHYGSVAQAVTVADPLVLIPSYPRFIAPGDEFQIPIELYNKTGRAGLIVTHLKVKGPVSVVGQARQETTLAAGEQKRLLYFVKASTDAGVAVFHVEAQGAGARSVVDDELAVRPGNALSTHVEQGELAPGQSRKISVPGGFIPFGQQMRLTVSSNPLIRYLRSLDYLIQYPYGCTEQLSAQIFPLLYFKTLGFATGRFEDKANAVDRFVQAGIDEIEKRQMSDGQFLLWPGGEPASRWVNEFASHALIQAKEAGYTVRPIVMERLTAWLQQGQVVPQNEGRLDRRTHNQAKFADTYLLYLKTLIGSPDRESMTQLFNANLPYLGEADRALLSASFSQVGDHETGERVLAPNFKSRFLYREQFGDFNSPLRNTALYLWALTQANPASPKVSEIVDYLGQNLTDGHFGTTQDNTWTFTALAGVFKTHDAPIKMDLRLNDMAYRTVTGHEASYTDNALSGKTLTLTNQGTQKAYFYLMAEGTPREKALKAESKGLSITRTFMDTSGKPANLTNVIQGDLVVITLTVTPEKNALQNVVIVDLMPAGFEIENPRLRSRGQLAFDPSCTFNPAYEDIRDDRILLFANQMDGTQTFSYTVRAVTPGHFDIPNAYAEAMYDPAVHGASVETRPLIVVDHN